MISKDIYGNEYEVNVTDLTWRPAAYGIVVRDGVILLVKIEDGYHLPGGGLNLGEDPKEAVIREVQEESGIIVRNPKLIDAVSTFFTWEHLQQAQTYSHVHSLLFYYACEISGGTFGKNQLDEYETHAGLTAEWVKLTELDDITVGATVDWRPIVREYLGL